MNTITVSPAFGRDYKKRLDAIAAWQEGKDFQIQGFGHYSGSYVSSRDAAQLKADGYDTVQIRYKDLRFMAFVDL
jgi:hypothetical protein